MLYGAASFLHFAHNAEFLVDYPNLPEWLTRPEIYAAWLGLTVVGIVGYLLTRGDREVLGFGVLSIYASLGLDGLAHYSRAPMTAHAAAMNLTIWFEVVAATLVLIAIVGIFGGRLAVSQRDA